MVPNFITQAISNKPITVYGDGGQTRSLCFVSDLVDALICTMETEDARGEVINLGNPVEFTVLEYAELIRSLTCSSSELVHRAPAVGDDPQRRRPDITKAQRLLGWEPQVDLSEGLNLTIEYFRAELGHTRSDEAST